MESNPYAPVDVTVDPGSRAGRWRYYVAGVAFTIGVLIIVLSSYQAWSNWRFGLDRISEMTPARTQILFKAASFAMPITLLLAGGALLWSARLFLQRKWRPGTLLLMLGLLVPRFSHYVHEGAFWVARLF